MTTSALDTVIATRTTLFRCPACREWSGLAVTVWATTERGGTTLGTVRRCTTCPEPIVVCEGWEQ